MQVQAASAIEAATNTIASGNTVTIFPTVIGIAS